MENSVIPKKMSNTKLKLSDLNPHLMCVLCGGYYIDATTIVECLHSFCRSCIVKHLESCKYCPICEVQVHKTKPLINIRPDKTLQEIVYKLVPGLFASEMRNRRKFYGDRPHYIKPNDSESAGEVSGDRKIYINDENITFSLVYHVGPINAIPEDSSYREINPPAQTEKRYFKCPTGVTIYHLKKLLRAKYDLNENNYKMEIYFRDQSLHDDLTLLDVSYIYLWKTKGSLDLTFKIFENIVKRQKMEGTNDRGVISAPKDTEVVIPRPESTPKPVPEAMQQKEEEEKKEKEEKVEEKKKEEEEKKETEKRRETIKEKTEPVKMEETKSEIAKPVTSEKPEPKENGVSGSEAKEVQLQISESGVMSVSQVEDGSEIVRTVEESAAKVTNNQLITGLGVNKEVKGNGDVGKPSPKAVDTTNRHPEKRPQSKPSKPYKTIRCSPNTWHPVIPKEKLRPTLMKNSDEPKKPLKFFKNRNIPRYLGNPSSGVKPMYTESFENNTQVEQEKKKPPEEKKPEPAKSLNKILKIDPKTLRPIEKEEMKVTPNTPNLLTNPFIPNNHFLFRNLHLLPPNPGNYSNNSEPKSDKTPHPGFKSPGPNGTYPPICFPTPEHAASGFYPFANLTKPPNFPFPVGDKMDPLLRATRLSPFGNLAGLNVAGFHASLPPSISRLLNPHHHFRKISQSADKKNKDESTKDTSKSCDDSLALHKPEKEERKSTAATAPTTITATTTTTTATTATRTEEKKEKHMKPEEETPNAGGKHKDRELNGETSESASKTDLTNNNSITDKETDKNKDADKDR